MQIDIDRCTRQIRNVHEHTSATNRRWVDAYASRCAWRRGSYIRYVRLIPQRIEGDASQTSERLIPQRIEGDASQTSDRLMFQRIEGDASQISERLMHHRLLTNSFPPHPQHTHSSAMDHGLYLPAAHPHPPGIHNTNTGRG